VSGKALLAVVLLAAAARAGEPEPAEDARALASPRADARERTAAAARLGEAAGPGLETALRALLPALDDPSPDVRREVAGSLGRLRDERAMPAIERRMSIEADPGVLAGLLLAVGACGGRYAVPLVLPRCDDGRQRVRAAAATALGDLGGEVARQRLLGLLREGRGDPDWTVRSSATLALARCGERSDAGSILEAYREGGGAAWWLARASLAKAVAALDVDPVPTLDRLMADPDGRVASSAAIALVRTGRAHEVVARLSDPRPGVRAAAAAAASEVPSAGARLSDLAVTDPDRAVRWSAALALSRRDDPVSDALLVEGLASNDPAVSLAALAECRRKTGVALGRDPDAWRRALAERRRRLGR
jgi:HEAT repeat protein